MSDYSCGVHNCGNGECVHKPLKESCPQCGAQLIENTTNGVVFCSGRFELCGYETEKNHFERNYKGMIKADPQKVLTGGEDWSK